MTGGRVGARAVVRVRLLIAVKPRPALGRLPAGSTSRSNMLEALRADVDPLIVLAVCDILALPELSVASKAFHGQYSLIDDCVIINATI